ncbi:MAG: metallophosphoesterase family protein [Thermoleophilaceae bacterium]
MASRLVPLLFAASIAASGCGGDGSDGAHAARAAASSQRPFVASVRGGSARIWAIGDSAGGGAAGSVARLIARGRPDRVLYLGDLYPAGSAETFRTSFARVYGALAPRIAPTPGNHDWPLHRTGYDPYWRRIHGRAPPQWYSFTAGGWRVIELNSETGSRSAQLAWLRGQLRRRGDCRLVFWHRPRYSAGVHGDNADMDPYWRALEGHARLVVSGHDHDMQRFYRRSGLIQLVSGAGGKSHYAINHQRGYLAFTDDRHWGALRIDLQRGRARMAFVATSGHVLDTHTAACDP